ncbi:MAG: DHH family phosphoesterase [Spirochaetes bacterium]|jgi:nanoRNase/pAp phosphatase (c-di-AMP/oligoRNAs hydrolase)|nr:DHH family phosphoesterase [Spirochaetota bacterium]
MKEKLNQLKKIFQKDDKLLIIINPDPDSIASALALKRLCKSWISSVTITQTRETRRMENRMMQKLLGIKLENLSKINLSEFTKAAIVDGQPDFFGQYAIPHVNIIIDHHPTKEDYPAEYKDIQPQVGATSTIMQEYIEAAKIKPSSKLATAMCYGIKTDTENFERNTIRRDAIAFGKLFAYAHPEVLTNIEKWNIPKECIPIFQKALNDFKIKRDIISVYLGEIKISDYAVMVADFLKSFEGIQLSVVIAGYNNQTLVILRSFGGKYNVGQMASAAFGEIGSAGGHRTMARVEMDSSKLSEVPDLSSNKKVVEFIVRELIKKRKKSGRA